MENETRTCEIFTKLRLHLQSTVISLLRLLVRHPSIHFSAISKYFKINLNDLIKFTHMMDSTDFGLMKTAMGYN
jgi:hypothetical protein